MRGRGLVRGGYCLALALLVALAIGRARPALAHAILVRSDPAQNARLQTAPKVVSLYFSEPLEARFSKAKLVDPNGAQFDDGESRVDAADATHLTLDVKPLKPGFYSVAWTSVSKTDGHKLQGAVTFILLNPDGSLPDGALTARPAVASSGTSATGPVDVAAFWLAILGAVALFGGALFALAVSLPAAAVLGAETESVRAVALRLQRRLLWLALASLAAGELLTLLQQLRQNGGLDSLGQLFGTSFGQYLGARLGLGLVVAACVLLLGRFDGRESRAPLLSLVAFCSFGILLCFSLTSHAAAAGSGSAWATLSDLIHLAMVGVWVGGLLSLGLLLRAGGRKLALPARVRYQAALVGHFSPLAAAAVTLILLSGTFNALVEVPSGHALWSTGYGRALLLKLALIAPLLAVGGLNPFLLRPRLRDAACGASMPAAERLRRRLMRTVALEAGLGVVVLIGAALLVILPPARGLLAGGQASRPVTGSSVYSNSAPADDLTVKLTVSPNRVGENTYRVLLTTSAGPVSDASLVRLDFTFADPSLGGSKLPLVPTGNGVYESPGANFAQIGRWRVSVVIRRPNKDDALTSFIVEVPDAAGNLTTNRRTTVDAFASPSKLFSTNQLGGIALVLAGLLPLALRRRLWNLGAPTGAMGTFLGVGALMLGGTLFFASHQEGTTDLALLTNPVPLTNASVDAGKAVYMQNCAVCHGQGGHGDGPQARSLNPQPVDLTVHVGLHPDGVLWGWITYGIPRTAMPAWRGQLSDAQRWDVVNFLRGSFQASAEQAPDERSAVASAWADALMGATDADP